MWGLQRMMIEDTVEGRLGALQVHRAGYLDNLDSVPLSLNLPYTPELLEKVKAVTGGFKLAPNFVENLKETVARFNGYAETGLDEEFGRGEDPISLTWSEPPP